MEQRQVHELLIRASAIDNRIVSDVAIAGWQAVLDLAPDVTIDDACAALAEHFRDRPDVWLKPGHIVTGARAIAGRRARAERVAAGPQVEQIEAVPKPADFEQVYADELAAHRAARAAQTNDIARAIAAHPAGNALETHRPDLTDEDIEAELRAIGARRRAAREELLQREQDLQP